jgi:hypothetical protein
VIGIEMLTREGKTAFHSVSRFKFSALRPLEIST